MIRFFLRSIQGRILAILLLFMTISLLGTWLIMRDMSQNIMTSEKSNKLLLTANLLDSQLGDRDYQDILAQYGVENASREEQIDALNRELTPLGEAMTNLYPALGVGYYSLVHDAIDRKSVV